MLTCPMMIILAGVSTDVSDNDFVIWAQRQAIPIEELDSERGQRELDALFADKRFVFLGESDHYIDEKYEFQLQFIAELYKRGWRYVSTEGFGRSDSFRIDHFLETGRDLYRIRELRYFPVLCACRLFPLLRPLTIPHFERWQRRLWQISQIRALGQVNDRLHCVAFDLDFAPGGAFDDVRQRLEPYIKKHPPIQEFLDSFLSLRKESPGERLIRLDALTQKLDERKTPIEILLPSETYAEIYSDIVIYRESIRFLLKWGKEGREKYIKRERVMMDQFDDVLMKLNPDEKVILMGHCMHLSKKSGSVGKLYSGYFVPTWPSIGEHIANRFPDSVCSIWLMYDHGTNLKNRARGVDRFALGRIESSPECVEHLLARVPHKNFLIPIDGKGKEYLDKDRRIRVHGSIPARANLAKQVDAIYFVREATAPGGLELPKPAERLQQK
jgi:hypothetical protein